MDDLANGMWYIPITPSAADVRACNSDMCGDEGDGGMVTVTLAVTAVTFGEATVRHAMVQFHPRRLHCT